LEYHSPELKLKVKEMLAKDFQVIYEDPTPEGTMFFINQSLMR
jgi:hypothetical protein